MCFQAFIITVSGYIVTNIILALIPRLRFPPLAGRWRRGTEVSGVELLSLGSLLKQAVSLCNKITILRSYFV